MDACHDLPVLKRKRCVPSSYDRGYRCEAGKCGRQLPPVATHLDCFSLHAFKPAHIRDSPKASTHDPSDHTPEARAEWRQSIAMNFAHLTSIQGVARRKAKVEARLSSCGMEYHLDTTMGTRRIGNLMLITDCVTDIRHNTTQIPAYCCTYPIMVPPTKDCIVVKHASKQFSITPDAVLPVVKCEVEATAAATGSCLFVTREQLDISGEAALPLSTYTCISATFLKLLARWRCCATETTMDPCLLTCRNHSCFRHNRRLPIPHAPHNSSGQTSFKESCLTHSITAVVGGKMILFRYNDTLPLHSNQPLVHAHHGRRYTNLTSSLLCRVHTRS